MEDEVVEPEVDERGRLSGVQAVDALGITFKCALFAVSPAVRMSVLVTLLADALSEIEDETERKRCIEWIIERALGGAEILRTADLPNAEK